MGTLILLCSEKMATMSRVAFKIAFSATATCNGGGPPIEDLPFPQRIRKLLGGVVDESRYNYNYWSQGGTVGREHQQAILGNEDMWLIAPQHLKKLEIPRKIPTLYPVLRNTELWAANAAMTNPLSNGCGSMKENHDVAFVATGSN